MKFLETHLTPSIVIALPNKMLKRRAIRQLVNALERHHSCATSYQTRRFEALWSTNPSVPGEDLTINDVIKLREFEVVSSEDPERRRQDMSISFRAPQEHRRNSTHNQRSGTAALTVQPIRENKAVSPKTIVVRSVIEMINVREAVIRMTNAPLAAVKVNVPSQE
ncbi:hypothetical protein ANCCAN_09595 [Ancylostoma caninum]|uniref:Uncharacterized protein n=1 Tax=Ancylostoma caninum TaxID=29170 RepID=A0A368GJ13_ANCCA|nr:hypothetical protein ANCCAN_09595 [Ancylostoma caninum]